MTTRVLTKLEFEQLLAAHRQLIELANDFEFHLYSLGEQPDDHPVSACQRCAGALLGRLREYLFFQDQHVLPMLEK